MKNSIKKIILGVALSLLMFTGVAHADRTFSLPNQTGHAGQFLQTNGTNPLWASAGGGGGGTVTSVSGVNSITATPNPITATGTLQLVNDTATPGNLKYYGTDGAGARGFFPLTNGNQNLQQVLTVGNDGGGINIFNVPDIQDIGGGASIAVDTRILYDNGAIVSEDWDNRILYDASGVTPSVEWDNRFLKDNGNGLSIDWEARLLKDNLGATTLDWFNKILYDQTNIPSIEWNTRQGLDTIGNLAIDWNFRILQDSSGFNTLDWNNGILQDSAGNPALTWLSPTNLQFNAYPNTRDDSGTFTPTSFLYTGASGEVYEAPFSSLPPATVSGTPTEVAYFDANTGALTSDSNFTRDQNSNFNTSIGATDGSNQSTLQVTGTGGGVIANAQDISNNVANFAVSTTNSGFSVQDSGGTNILGLQLNLGAQFANFNYATSLNNSEVIADPNKLKSDHTVSATTVASSILDGSQSLLQFDDSNGANTFNASSTLNSSGNTSQYQNITSGITSKNVLDSIQNTSQITDVTNYDNSLSIFSSGATFQVKNIPSNILATIGMDTTGNIASESSDSAAYDSKNLISSATNTSSFLDLSNSRSSILSLNSINASLFWSDFSSNNFTGGININGGGASVSFQDNTAVTYSTSAYTNTYAILNFENQSSFIDTGFLANDRVATMGITNAAGNNTTFKVDDNNQYFIANKYPSTRDDTGSFTPVNFIYTDTTGIIYSAPLSALPVITPALTSTQIAYGDPSNLMTSSIGFTYNPTTIFQSDVTDGITFDSTISLAPSFNNFQYTDITDNRISNIIMGPSSMTWNFHDVANGIFNSFTADATQNLSEINDLAGTYDAKNILTPTGNTYRFSNISTGDISSLELVTGGTTLSNTNNAAIQMQAILANGTIQLLNTSGGNGIALVLDDNAQTYTLNKLGGGGAGSNFVVADNSGILSTVRGATLTDHVSIGSANSDLGPTALTDTGPATYRFSYYLVTSTGDLAAGAITLTITYTDTVTGQTVTSVPLPLTTTGGFIQGTQFLELASGNVQYSITNSGIYGSSFYHVRFELEKLQ